MQKLSFLLKIIQKEFKTIKKENFIKTESNGYEITKTYQDENTFTFKFFPISRDGYAIIITTGKNGQMIKAEEDV